VFQLDSLISRENASEDVFAIGVSIEGVVLRIFSG
jgi:hypothetical protein